jgi:hypothetical protein
MKFSKLRNKKAQVGLNSVLQLLLYLGLLVVSGFVIRLVIIKARG